MQQRHTPCSRRSCLPLSMLRPRSDTERCCEAGRQETVEPRRPPADPQGSSPLHERWRRGSGEFRRGNRVGAEWLAKSDGTLTCVCVLPGVLAAGVLGSERRAVARLLGGYLQRSCLRFVVTGNERVEICPIAGVADDRPKDRRGSHDACDVVVPLVRQPGVFIRCELSARDEDDIEEIGVLVGDDRKSDTFGGARRIRLSGRSSRRATPGTR